MSDTDDFRDKLEAAESGEGMKTKWVKHIIKEGSRTHVIHWDKRGRHCNIENCEVNKLCRTARRKDR